MYRRENSRPRATRRRAGAQLSRESETGLIASLPRVTSNVVYKRSSVGPRDDDDRQIGPEFSDVVATTRDVNKRIEPRSISWRDRASHKRTVINDQLESSDKNCFRAYPSRLIYTFLLVACATHLATR